MENQWKLGADLIPSDNILDGVSFDDIILAVHHSRHIDEKTVKSLALDILNQRLTDYYFLLENNMDEIIRRAKRGRSE